MLQLPEHDCDRLEEVHKCLNQFEQTRYAQPHKRQIHQYDVTPFQEFQHHTQCLRRDFKVPHIQLIHLFEAWFHVARRQAARKRMNQTSKAARKHRLQQIFEKANNAERAQDSFQFYQAIRELAPKQPFQRIQLRSNTGDLLGPAASADVPRDWYQELYSADDMHTVTHNFNWPFTAEELSDGLQKLPPFKALSPEYAPAPIWQAAASMTASYLQPFLESRCLFDRLPTCWSEGVLTFLCKPGKSGRSPTELRPIALLEPSGKTVMGMLAYRLMQTVSTRLLRLPQLAYLSMRGSEEAIMRVRKHWH